jgi:hypothetical protein
MRQNARHAIVIAVELLPLANRVLTFHIRGVIHEYGKGGK